MVLYCARQDIGLREYRQIRSKLLSIENENFKLLPKYSKHKSPEVQNDIIKVIHKISC